MCTVLLSPGDNPIAVKYIISYNIISYHITYDDIRELNQRLDNKKRTSGGLSEDSIRRTVTAKCSITGEEGTASLRSVGRRKIPHGIIHEQTVASAIFGHMPTKHPPPTHPTTLPRTN